MFDLGRSFLTSVERSPNAIAIVDGDVRLTYAEWMSRIGSLAGGLQSLGLRHGDHLLIVMQNRWQMATLHWACQFLGVIATPLNWRAKADEIEFCARDADARAIAYDAASADSVADSTACSRIPRVAVQTGTAGTATTGNSAIDEEAANHPTGSDIRTSGLGIIDKIGDDRI